MAVAKPTSQGRWVTIRGARVFIGKGGRIEKGPPALLAGEEVLSRGRATGREHVLLLDPTGRTVGESEGDEGSADFPQVPDLGREGAGLTVVHNHPKGGPLSEGDLKSLASREGVRTIVAHGHDGDNHSATLRPGKDRGEFYREVRRVYGEEHSARAEALWDLPPGPAKQARVELMKKDVARAALLRLQQDGWIEYHNWKSF